MSCSLHSELPQPKPVCVNGTVVPRDAIAREVQHHPASKPIGSWIMATRALVIRELLLQEAYRLGIEAEPLSDAAGRRETCEEALVRWLVEREVKTPEPDEASCRRYYMQNQQRFRSPEIFEAAHILIGAHQDDAEAYIHARGIAESVIAELNEHPGRFEELARMHSECPSAEQGGNLGQITVGQTTPEFERALTGLEPGTMTCEPVATRYGFHVVRLLRRIEGRQLPFEAVASRIAEYLSEKVRRTAAAQYIARLVSRSAIEGITLPGADVHRVTSGIQVSGIQDAAQ